MGAIADAAQVLDVRIIRQLKISALDSEDVVAREQTELRRRQNLYRGGVQAASLEARKAILVDDGLATGSTMLVAVRHVRALKPARPLVAVPVWHWRPASDSGAKSTESFASPRLHPSMRSANRISTLAR